MDYNYDNVINLHIRICIFPPRGGGFCFISISIFSFPFLIFAVLEVAPPMRKHISRCLNSEFISN